MSRVECTCTNPVTEPHQPGCPVLAENLAMAAGLRASTDEPAVSGWQAATEAHMAASTSALGRNLQTQLDQLRDEYNAELAARVAAEKERDTLREIDQDNKIHVAVLTVDNEQLRKALDRWRKTGQDVIAQSGWIVARDGGRSCERCEQEIRRGEAYQYLGVDDLRHVYCPRPRKHLDAVKRERDDALAEVSRLRASNQTETTDG